MAMIANLSKVLADQHVEIGRLRAEIERLKAALREISELGDVRADEAAYLARAALTGKSHT